MLYFPEPQFCIILLLFLIGDSIIRMLFRWVSLIFQYNWILNFVIFFTVRITTTNNLFLLLWEIMTIMSTPTTQTTLSPLSGDNVFVCALIFLISQRIGGWRVIDQESLLYEKRCYLRINNYLTFTKLNIKPLHRLHIYKYIYITTKFYVSNLGYG